MTEFLPFFEQASRETGIPVELLVAQARQESSLRPNVVSRTGGQGLMQIQPSTARDPGYGVAPIAPDRVFDPESNIMFGARYLAARGRAAGVTDWNDPVQRARGLQAYNGGGDPNYVRNVERHMNGNNGVLPGVPAFQGLAGIGDLPMLPPEAGDQGKPALNPQMMSPMIMQLLSGLNPQRQTPAPQMAPMQMGRPGGGMNPNVMPSTLFPQRR